MSKIEKQQKFHETLLNIFYPPVQEQPHQDVKDEKSVDIDGEGWNADLLSVSDALSDSEEENKPDDVNDGSQKLTRAQRKRLRKKKMKEAASQRRKIIGPLLPSTDGEEVLENKDSHGSQEKPVSDMIISSAKKSDIGNDKQGEYHVCTAQRKLKNRRMSKRLGLGVVDTSVDELKSSQNRSLKTFELGVKHDENPCLEDGLCDTSPYLGRLESPK